MGLRGYNNPRQSPDVLSGQDCSLRERARQERVFPDKSVVGYPLVRKRLARQEVAIVVVNKAIFALENWPNGSVSAIGDQPCG